jgi:YD repeat-containing protein
VCTSFAYDDTGHLLTRTLGNGSVTSYQYDALGRQTREVIDPDKRNENGDIIYVGEKITTDYQYDASGNRTHVFRAPGGAAVKDIVYTFDALGRVLSVNYPDATPDVTYTYDAWGNRTTMNDTPTADGRWAYHYDQMNHQLGMPPPMT